jgi:hypothetical protein
MSARIFFFVALVALLCVPTAQAQPTDIWNNPQAEAEYLALEIRGQLRPDLTLAAQIKSDLAAIRTAYPQYADIRVLPSWMPSETLVGLTDSAFADYTAGTFHGFDPIYADLGVPSSTVHNFSKWLHLKFNQMYHGQRLSELFDPVEGVRYADPNGIIGDGNDIVARANHTYTLSRGSGDCPAGCISHQYFDFTVTNQGVFPGLFAPPPTSGDFNHDGIVNSADYVVLRNSSSNSSQMDEWRGNFGANTGSGNSAIPEPIGSSIIAIAIGCMLLTRRRQQ